MQQILEHIDTLLIEGVANLGFPDWLVGEFEQLVPNHRKNRFYLARYFKHSRAAIITRLLSGNALRHPFSLRERAKIAKKFGIRGIDVKPSDEYTVRETKEIDKKITEEIVKKVDTIDDLLTVRKKVRKAIDNKRKVQQSHEHVDIQIESNLDAFKQTAEYLILWMNNDEYAYRELKSINADELRKATKVAKQKAVKVKVDENRKVIELPKGYFWYKVTEEECRIEGENMNHCGRKSRARSQMYSLRDPSNEPHVTIEYDKRSNEIVQLRGNSNQMPKREYWDAVKAFVDETDAEVIDQYDEGEVETEFLEYITQDNGSYDAGSVNSLQALEWRAHELLRDIVADNVGVPYDLQGRVTVVSDEPELDVRTNINMDIWYEILGSEEQEVKQALDENPGLARRLQNGLPELVDVVFSENFNGVDLYAVEMDGAIVRSSGEPFITINGLQFVHDVADLGAADIDRFLTGVESALSADSMQQFSRGIKTLLWELR